jgi:arylsulfatase A-like enzyme
MIDFYIGKFFDHLRKLNLWDNTIVIFSSDHGEYAGQFKCFYKGLPYEGSTHVPLIIRNPFIKESIGKCVKQSVSNMDIFKTCADIAQADLGEYRCDSRSLEPLFSTENEEEWNDKSFFCDGESCHIVSGHYKLMKSPLEQSPDAVYEFYDLDERPLEKSDLIDSEEHSGLLEKMKKELDSWAEFQLKKRRKIPTMKERKSSSMSFMKEKNT